MALEASFLDQSIPLDGASHRDVANYAIVIPMRYAECAATLNDGSEVRFRNPRQFLGWSGSPAKRTFLFRNGERGIEIRTNRARQRCIREVLGLSGLTIVDGAECASATLTDIKASPRKVVARDGSLLFVKAIRQSLDDGVDYLRRFRQQPLHANHLNGCAPTVLT